MNVIQKALGVATGGDLSSYLPSPLANQVIATIREINIMRRLIRGFNMPARTWRKPRKIGNLQGYYIPDGVTATQSTFNTGTIEWVAKKLMAFTMLDVEATEDTDLPVIDQIMMDFAEALAESEEYALLQGDTNHLATAPTPDSATTANWYIRDPRLMFDGIFAIAEGTEAADSVEAAGATIDLDFFNKALFNLGKYGRPRNNLIALVPSDQAANMRTDSRFQDASAAGAALATAAFMTGLGGAGELDGVIAPVYGVPCYEVPLAPEGKVAIYNKNSPEIGDRRRIKFAQGEVIESDQIKYVVSERLAFNCNYPQAFVEIDNLSTTIVT